MSLICGELLCGHKAHAAQVEGFLEGEGIQFLVSEALGDLFPGPLMTLILISLMKPEHVYIYLQKIRLGAVSKLVSVL